MEQIPAGLLQAFADTHYIVHHEAPFVMHIGQPCPELKALMAYHNALSAAFITAWNPFSLRRGKQTNEQAHRRLAAALRLQRTTYLEGEGCGADDNWTPECSVLAFRVARRVAARLGRRFRQNAVIFVSYGKPAELMMLR